jgi:hypothetical protein
MELHAQGVMEAIREAVAGRSDAIQAALSGDAFVTRLTRAALAACVAMLMFGARENVGTAT